MSNPLPGQLELPLTPEPERLSGWEQIEREEGGPLPERVLTPETGAPYVAGSATSREAAAWQDRTGHAANLEAWALGAFVAVHDTGLTDEELDRTARAAGLAFQTLRPRRVALWHKGLVHDLGERRQTASGRRATVWVVTAAGHREWEGCR